MIRKMRKQLRKSRGFTLVELMIVVAIVGILAALAIYGVRKYMTNAKTAEARNGVGQMSKDASSAYYKEGMAGSVLDWGQQAGVANKICPSAPMVPDSLKSVAAQKWQSRPANWNGPGWDCLHFSMSDPQYYAYKYDAVGSDAPGSTLTCTATGDLDGDTIASVFTVIGEVKEDAGTRVLVMAPNMVESAPDE